MANVLTFVQLPGALTFGKSGARIESGLVKVRPFGGAGRIFGSLSKSAQPCAGYKVQLYHSRTRQLVRETATDAAGSWAFDGIDRSQPFDVEALDPAGVYRAIVVVGRYPEL